MLVTAFSYYLDFYNAMMMALDRLPEAFGVLMDAFCQAWERCMKAAPAARAAALGAAWALAFAVETVAHAVLPTARSAALGASSAAWRLACNAVELVAVAAYGLADLWEFRKELIEEARGRE